MFVVASFSLSVPGLATQKRLRRGCGFPNHLVGRPRISWHVDFHRSFAASGTTRSSPQRDRDREQQPATSTHQRWIAGPQCGR